MDTKTPSSALAFLQKSSLPMLIQEEIERLIMTGVLPVGSRVNESELSQRFNTSRGPIREALRALEEVGLVRTEKNRGMFVREISFEEADEIYELREALEEIIGRRAAIAITDESIERLKAMLEDMRFAAHGQDLERYAQLNLKFHDILLAAAGSAKLTETYQRLIKELSLFRMRALGSGGALTISADEHTEIVNAIAARNPRKAGQALRLHVADSRARMHKVLGRPSASPAFNSAVTPTKES